MTEDTGNLPTRPDSAKHLVKPTTKRRPVLSCLSFNGWEPEEVESRCRVLVRMAAGWPGAFATGEQVFPPSQEDRAKFFQMTGFSEGDARMLSML